jgi:hypothetical protein
MVKNYNLIYIVWQQIMSKFSYIKEFQYLYGEHFTRIQTIFGKRFYHWLYIIRRVLLKVAKKLSRPYSRRVRKCFESCFNLLTRFDSEYSIEICLKLESFISPLQQVDPRLAILLVKVISDLFTNVDFSRFVDDARKDFIEGSSTFLIKGSRTLAKKTSYCTLRVFNSFSRYPQSFPEWVSLWVSLIPVPRPIVSRKFLRSRMNLCVFGYFCKHLSSIPLKRRYRVLCISGFFKFLIARLFCNYTQQSSQMQMIMLRNF